MSNKLIKNKNKLREDAINILSNPLMSDISSELGYAMESEDIEFVKEKLWVFYGTILSYECFNYIVDNNMDEHIANDLYLKCFDVIKNDFNAIEERIAENNAIGVDGRQVSFNDVRKKTKEVVEAFEGAELPDELIDLVKNCKGMKVDEFYKKMDEISKDNRINIKHSDIGNDILQGKDIIEALNSCEKKNNKNIIKFEKRRKKN